jgi:multiple antibiotic resistance protein
MELEFSLKETISAFIVLFAMIDPIGLAPLVIDLQGKSGPIKAGRAALISLGTLLAFLFCGNMILQLFGVDIHSFAAAGALVIFIMSLEMILGVEIFHYNDGPTGMSTIVPVVFPLIAGAGTFTALLALRAEYNILNIVIALVLNIGIVYLVLRYLHGLEHVFGKGGIYILRKFFGIILLAISVKLFTSNISSILSGVV